MIDGLRLGKMRPHAILSRCLVGLALVLFGLPQGHGDRSATEAGPTAESRIDQVPGILSVQRHLLRAVLPGDDTPDAADRADNVPATPTLAELRIPAAERATRNTPTIRILPPVRGPPAA